MVLVCPAAHTGASVDGIHQRMQEWEEGEAAGMRCVALLTLCERVAGLQRPEERLAGELSEVAAGQGEAVPVKEVLVHGFEVGGEGVGSEAGEEDDGVRGVDEEEEDVVGNGIDGDGEHEEAPQGEAEAASGKEDAQEEEIGSEVGDEQEDVGHMVQPVGGRLHHELHHLWRGGGWVGSSW